jgi:uncharacterized integral membrane protein (TIGR00698 family)
MQMIKIKTFKRNIIQKIRDVWPGVVPPLLIMLGSTFVSENYGGSQFLYALLFGLAFHFLFLDASYTAGIEFCAKTLLRIGVALLGTRITLAQLGEFGIAPLVTASLGVLSTIAFGAWLARRIGLKTDFGLLCGAAVAICGASAALAVSAVMPKTKENEQHTLLAVVGVTGLSTLAMILYPILVKVFMFDDISAGIFLGGTIHDVAQVVGAGSLVSNETGDIAVVIGLSYYWQHRKSNTTNENIKKGPLLPFFLICFIVLILVNSNNFIEPWVSTGLSQASRFLLVVAIGALGMKTSFKDLALLGWRPIALMLIETIWLAVVFLIYLCAFRS